MFVDCMELKEGNSLVNRFLKFVEMSDIKINAKAYCKLILHAVKYPHCAVNGVLLAKCSAKNKEIEFVDAVPLFHLALNLTPMAEVALTQVRY